MLKIGIYTSYVKNEIALASVQFADWLVRCGFQVELLSDGKIESGIHPIWDKKVRKATDKTSILRWAFNATHLCWFTSSTNAYEQSQIVSSNTKKKKTINLFFPHWCRWSDHDATMFHVSQQSVCLSQDLFRWIDAKFPDIQTSSTWANLVSPAVIATPKQGFTVENQRRVLVLLDHSVARDIGFSFFDLCRVLLVSHSNLCLTFASLQPLSKKYRSNIRALQNKYPTRVSFVANPSYSDYVHLARQHDWIYLAATKYQFGSFFSQLQVSTVPILCHDVPPAGGHITDLETGKLIPCGIVEEPEPAAIVRISDIRDSLDSVLRQSETDLVALQAKITQHIFKKQKMFEAFVMKEFVA